MASSRGGVGVGGLAGRGAGHGAPDATGGFNFASRGRRSMDAGFRCGALLLGGACGSIACASGSLCVATIVSAAWIASSLCVVSIVTVVCVASSKQRLPARCAARRLQCRPAPLCNQRRAYL